MIEQKALAFANMYGVLGTLQKLCELDERAKEILQKLKAKAKSMLAIGEKLKLTKPML